jgi:hypothetical protein
MDIEKYGIFEIKPSDVNEEQTIEHCKGLTFRGFYNQYYLDGKFEIKQGIKLLKRKSCSGCEQCFFLHDALRELSDIEGAIVLPKEGLRNGKLYSVQIINESRDWESGMVDAYDLEIFEATE